MELCYLPTKNSYGVTNNYQDGKFTSVPLVEPLDSEDENA